MDRRQGWFALAFVVCVAVVPALLGYDVATSVPSIAAGVAVVCLEVAFGCTRGGIVTIDPPARELTWRRPFGFGRDQRWGYREVQSVEVLRDGTWSHRVRITFADRSLVLRLPARANEFRFAESFRRLSVAPDDGLDGP